MRAPTMLRKKGTAHYAAVPVGARIARPLSEFVQNFEFARRTKKEIKRNNAIDDGVLNSSPLEYVG